MTRDADNQFAERIHQAIRTAGGSQAALADELSVGQSTVSRWARGEAFPSPEHLRRLAGILDVTTDTLLKEAP